MRYNVNMKEYLGEETSDSHPPDFTSNLEWMLQSGQAGDAALISALVAEQYAPLYHLVLSLLEDPAAAGEVARQALVKAVLDAHLYRGESGVQRWLFSIAVQVCRNYLRRRFLRRFAFLQGSPHHLSGSLARWKLDELAYVIKNRMELSGRMPAFPSSSAPAPADLEQARLVVEHRVKQARRRRLVAIRTQEFGLVGVVVLLVLFVGRALNTFPPAPEPTGIAPERVLETRIVYITPTPAPSSTPIPFPDRAIVITAAAGETLVDISARTGMDLEILQALNGLAAGSTLAAGQAVMIGLGAPPRSLVTPTPVTPVAPLEPLSIHSSADAIRERVVLSKSLWRTLWADAQSILYGPSNYFGPPKVRREQVWINQPFDSLSLAGDLAGELEHVWLMDGGRVYEHNLINGQVNLYDTGGNIYFLEVAEFFFPDRFRIGYGPIEVVGSEQVAGRAALVVDWFSNDPIDLSRVEDPLTRQNSYLGRYWVDTLTGVILRRQRFDQAEPHFLVGEVVVTDIAFDVDFPNQLFDHHLPVPTGFFQDYRGEPYPLGAEIATPAGTRPAKSASWPRRTPPPDFNPAGSRLTFRWLGSPVPGDPGSLAEVFAGNYLLGQVALGDPFRLLCKRSPDGRLAAFSERPELPPYLAAPLRWFSLTDLSRVYLAISSIYVSDFAFAPDSRRLALSGCDERRSECGLYVIDLTNSEQARLVEMAHISSLAWSPDGRQLAFLVWTTAGGGRSNVWVIDARTGEARYNQPLELDAGYALVAPANAPLHRWGVPFPNWVQPGLDACIAPPEN